MNAYQRRLPLALLLSILIMIIALMATACSSSSQSKNKRAYEKILKSEVISFQKEFGISFNAIAEAIDNDEYYESAARKHIDKFYDFSDGEVMFKFTNDDSAPFRYSYDGILSHLIGKNNKFPNDLGIANKNWRKIDWKNNGLSIHKDLAIAIGSVNMIDDKGESIVQNYTMCMKKDSSGNLKLIAHKISFPCDS